MAIVIGRCWIEIGVHWLTEVGSWRLAINEWRTQVELNVATLSFSHTTHSSIRRSLFLSIHNKHFTGLHCIKESSSSSSLKKCELSCISTKNLSLSVSENVIQISNWESIDVILCLEVFFTKGNLFIYNLFTLMLLKSPIHKQRQIKQHSSTSSSIV